MTLCPIAIVATCKKCPVFKLCPMKSIIGDYKKVDNTQTKKRTKKTSGSTKRKG